MTAATHAYLQTEKRPVLGWVLAALVILSLHGLLGYFLLYKRESGAPGQVSPPAIMVDLAPMAVAPPAQQDTELPPAPEKTEEAPPDDMKPDPDVTPPPDAPAPLVLADKPPEVIVPEAPLAPKPEVVLAQVPKPQPPAPKPVKKAEKIVKPAHKPTADKTAAPKPVNAAPARETAASESGTPSMSTASWQSMVSARLNGVKHCPAGGGDGTASVGFAISGSGGVSGARLVRSSGNGEIDAEAVSMIHRAAPYPPTPSGSTISLTVPIHFGC